ncbi:hypothetical protein TSUD_227660 [Trifolium subterraneum]|uniref:Reverse transcriptase zinc-binding domain-containing protein n=1 Tax=Trifolium subterraneum TaxID=3900 RepID=A0A2Z6MG31_TRISU|nr:hypothetical protein TSUD_227660 [Trifolium subterraneum]
MLLRSFELVSGLKINFVKSQIYGINVDDRVLAADSTFLSCKIGSIPFKFLGIPVGPNPRRRETWKPVVEAMNKRLNTWNSRHLSFGGCLTLINSWDQICLPKELGGLGVKNLDLFNVALLNKWKWRFLTDNDALWADLLRFRYGHLPTLVIGGSPIPLGAKYSTWWKDIMSSGREAESDGFQTNVRAVVGNGNNIGFWKFKWFGNQPFNELFPNLFAKETHLNVMIAERLGGNGVSYMSSWQWVDRLSTEEANQMKELSEPLVGFSLHPFNSDRWRWIQESSGIFSVKSYYNVLIENSHMEELDINVLTAIRQLCRNDVPSKVLFFGWRLLLERPPTRVALNHRGILLNQQDLSCIFCSLIHEDCSHLFFQCPFSKSVWEAVCTWVEKGYPTWAEGWNHFRLFGDMVKLRDCDRIRHLI